MIDQEKLFNLTNNDEDFLQKLINHEIKESSILEYKRELPQNNSELAKDISSFANSNGGIIIYGIEEIDHVPKNLYPLEAELGLKIENIILSSVDPPLHTKIVPINSTIAPGKNYYVVYIPKSLDAPFMLIVSNDCRYYKRVNFSSIKMHDNEVRALMELNFKLKQESLSDIKKHLILFYETNAEQDESEYLRLSFKTNQKIDISAFDLMVFRDKEYYMNGLLKNHNISNYEKGKIIECGLFDKDGYDDYNRNYITLNEDGYIEYVHLGICIESSIGKQLNSHRFIPDLIGFIYFIKDFCIKYNILSECLLYFEINEIKKTLLVSSSSIRYTNRQYSLVDKWEDDKSITSSELISNSNEIIKYFADRLYHNYGYDNCPNIIDDNGILKYYFR